MDRARAADEKGSKMKRPARRLFGGIAVMGLCCGTAAAADLSILGKWTGQYPSDKLADGKPLWDQPEIQEAMRVAMGNRFFVPSLTDMPPPEAPVVSDGKGLYAVWTCSDHGDCGGNSLLVFFDAAAGSAQVCYRSSDGTGGKVQDLWLAHGSSRPLPTNGCGVGARDPFAPLRKYSSK
jgi:hypothetical protein